MEEKFYKCIESFKLPKWDSDNDCFSGDEMTVEEGSFWFESNSCIIGGEVSLEAENGEWIEISKENLKEYFEELAIKEK